MRFFWKLWLRRRGQDLIEYALVGGFIATAAAAIMPNIAISVSTLLSKAASTLGVAAQTGAGEGNGGG